jgi:hypothetical protein
LDLSGLGYGLVEGFCKQIRNLPVPYNAGKFLSGYTIGNLSSSAQLHSVS